MTRRTRVFPGTLVLCLLAFGAGAGAADESLSRQLQEIDGMRKGPKTPFAKVESQAQDLLKKHTTPEEQGRIYYQMTDAYGQGGLFHLELARRVVEYAQKALEYPQEPVHRIELYMYWGVGIRAAGRNDPFQPVRKAAAEVNLKGLKEARQYNIPEKPREVSLGSLLARPADGGPLTEQEFKRRSDVLLAAQRQARYEANLIHRRQVLVNQIVELYTSKPYAATELRDLATQVLEDSASVEELMRIIEEKGALKDDVVEEEPSEPPPAQPAWRWPVVLGINALAVGAICVITWLARRRRASARRTEARP